MYRYLIRPLLFLLPAESAHHFAAFFLKVLSWPILNPIIRSFNKTPNSSKVSLMGIEFPSRVGIAAGFDKNATMHKGLSALGFGFVEIGTVTPLPQSGNEKPRLFRLIKDKGLINRMGFNNEGSIAITTRLKNRRDNIIIGGNIGKNKITPNDQAVNDYKKCFEDLYDFVDYFVVNVSSPNTPGLRELQDKDPLLNILSTLKQLSDNKVTSKPILLKIAPDLNNEELDDIVEIINKSGISGVIATNTTIGREGLITDFNRIEEIGMGGLSGKPLKDRSLEVVKYLAMKGNKSFVIIGVGGIFSANDAKDYINAGADLIQLYTGLIY